MTVAPIRPDTFEQAMRGALSAGLNWQVKLRYAQVLASSPREAHRRLAEHIRDAAELAAQDLLCPAPMRKSDRLPPVPEDNPRRGTIREGLRAFAALLALVVPVLVVWLAL